MTKLERKERSHGTMVYLNKIPISSFKSYDKNISTIVKILINKYIVDDSRAKIYKFDTSNKRAIHGDKSYKCTETLMGSYACYISGESMVYFQ